MIEHTKFTYSPRGKALEKQTKKQFDALKSINPFNKLGELNQITSMFPQNQLDNLIFNRLKEI